MDEEFEPRHVRACQDFSFSKLMDVDREMFSALLVAFLADNELKFRDSFSWPEFMPWLVKLIKDNTDTATGKISLTTKSRVAPMYIALARQRGPAEIVEIAYRLVRNGWLARDMTVSSEGVPYVLLDDEYVEFYVPYKV